MSTESIVAIADIVIVDRYRRDLGDVSDLAASIDEVGLLAPVVLAPDYRLIAGQRRIAAVQSLGHDVIEARVVHGLDDAVPLLKAERDENTCRKALTPTEEHALYEELLKLERPAARGRQGERTDLTETSGKLSQKSEPARARKLAAAGVTGNPGRHRTLDKVGEVKAAAEDKTVPEPVRATAQQALGEMDSTGRVDGSYQRFRDVQRAAEHAAETPGPVAGVTEHLASDQSLQDTSYVREFLRAIGDKWLAFDPERLGHLLDDDEFRLLEMHAASARRFTDTATRARRGLRLISGDSG